MADPTELALTSAQATALGGTDDAKTGMTFIVENAAFYDDDTNNNAVIGRILENPNNLRVVKNGTNPSLTYGVFSGEFSYAGQIVSYAGGTGTLANNDTNYVYLQANGTLVDNVTGFPTAEPHVRLATIATGTASAAAVTSQYDFADIVDNRGSAMWGVVGGPQGGTLVSQTLEFGDFTDNGDATGYIDFDTDTPADIIVIGWEAIVATGFTGDTTAVISVGVNGDTDAFSADIAQSVFVAATVGSASLAAESYRGAVTTVRVTVTGAADFGNISAGAMVVNFYYWGLK